MSHPSAAGQTRCAAVKSVPSLVLPFTNAADPGNWDYRCLLRAKPGSRYCSRHSWLDKIGVAISWKENA